MKYTSYYNDTILYCQSSFALRRWIEQYGMNTKSLSKVLDVEPSFLDNFYENKDKIPIEKSCILVIQ